MATPLQSLITAGTKLWLDSVDPDEVVRNRAMGATGATSNPIIISDLIKTGRFDELMKKLIKEGLSDEDLAWRMTDHLVRQAQEVFMPVWEQTKGNDGYVSFELDPLIEDVHNTMSTAERSKRYIELGKKWAAGHKNRMIKVPATPGGLGALEELCAAGVTLNVTLIFGEDQWKAAREAVWRGAQRRANLDSFKSVYSIFVSRLDVYTAAHNKDLSPAAQGMVGIVNAKRIWKMNEDFSAKNKTPLKQEMIFASTGVKNIPGQTPAPAWKYVAAFAGSDIETNPPATNAAVEKSGQTFTKMIDQMPPADVLKEIDQKVSMKNLVETLMREGLEKFADPQHALLELIGHKRDQLMAVAR